MKRVMKFVKKNIVGFIIGFLFMGIGIVTAATLVPATGVTYSNTNSSVTNVSEALDELFTKVNDVNSNVQIKQGVVSIQGIYNHEVELGFRPVYVQVTVVYNGTTRSLHVYDERIASSIYKMGNDTNNTVGLPNDISNAIYDSGFRLNEGYNYSGWQLYYVALSAFPE